VQPRRLATSFEGLNSSLAQSLSKLWSCKDLPNVGKLHLKRENLPGAEDVKNPVMLISLSFAHIFSMLASNVNCFKHLLWQQCVLQKSERFFRPTVRVRFAPSPTGKVFLLFVYHVNSFNIAGVKLRSRTYLPYFWDLKAHRIITRSIKNGMLAVFFHI